MHIANSISIFNNPVSVLSGGAPYERTTSFLFDSVDESIDLQTSAIMDDSMSAFSIAFWFKMSDTGVQIFYSCYAQSGHDIEVGHWSGSWKVAMRVADATVFVFNWTADTTTWHHCVVTYDGTEVTDTDRVNLWIDGVEVTLTSGGTGCNATTSSLMSSGSSDTAYIAQRSTGGYFYGGNMMNMALWNNHKLSNAEISEAYNSGSIYDYNLMSNSPTREWALSDPDSWGGSNWTVYDRQGNYDGTSINMEEADRETDVP